MPFRVRHIINTNHTGSYLANEVKIDDKSEREYSP